MAEKTLLSELQDNYGYTEEGQFPSVGEMAGSFVIAPAQITSDQDDYNPTGWLDADGDVSVRLVKLTASSGTRKITGLDAGTVKRSFAIIFINDSSSGRVEFKNNDGSSLADNRFLMQYHLKLYPRESVVFFYDTALSRWRPTNKN